MPADQGDGPKPGQEFTIRKNTQQGFIGPGSDRSLPSRLTPDQQSWYTRPHEELVGVFRTYIKGMEERTQGYWTPEEIVRTKLRSEEGVGDNPRADLFSH